MKYSQHACVALLAVFAAGTVSAQAIGKDAGYYAEAGYTPLQIHNDNNGFQGEPKLARLTVGKVITDNLAVEGFYAFTVAQDSTTDHGVTYNLNANMFGAYLKPKVAITQGIEAFARVGAVHSKFDDEYSSVSGTKLSYGLGIQAHLTQNVYAQVDYMNYYKQDGIGAKGFTVSVGTRF